MKDTNHKDIGKRVYIKVGDYAGEWGIVNAVIAGLYYIGLWGESESDLEFERNEITISRKQV